jgi:hypothetical protein
MTAVLAIPTRGARFAPTFSGPVLSLPSQGASDDAKRITDSLAEIKDWASRRLGSAIDPRVLKLRPAPTAERLDTALASAKVMTSNVAMHLDREWRDRLFAQLDDLLDVEDWHQEDEPLLDESFRTFLRLILYQKPKRRPGLGLSHRGHLIAAWTTGTDRLTLECAPDDTIRWVLSCEVNGERERAAGETHVARLPEILRPYGPDRWFADVDQAPG